MNLLTDALRKPQPGPSFASTYTGSKQCLTPRFATRLTFHTFRLASNKPLQKEERRGRVLLTAWCRLGFEIDGGFFSIGWNYFRCRRYLYVFLLPNHLSFFIFFSCTFVIVSIITSTGSHLSLMDYALISRSASWEEKKWPSRWERWALMGKICCLRTLADTHARNATRQWSGW